MTRCSLGLAVWLQRLASTSAVALSLGMVLRSTLSRTPSFVLIEQRYRADMTRNSLPFIELFLGRTQRATFVIVGVTAVAAPLPSTSLPAGFSLQVISPPRGFEDGSSFAPPSWQHEITLATLLKVCTLMLPEQTCLNGGGVNWGSLSGFWGTFCAGSISSLRASWQGWCQALPCKQMWVQMRMPSTDSREGSLLQSPHLRYCAARGPSLRLPPRL